MKIEREDLNRAIEKGIIDEEQADNLWNALLENYTGENEVERSRFNLANVAYYFGALIVIAAMGWLMGSAWESFGGAGLFFIALSYGVAFVLTGQNLYFEKNLKIPGGLLYTMAVWMTPLAIYGLQRWSGFWLTGDPGIYKDFYTWVKGSWALMEVGTIVAGLIALKYVKFPFLVAPIAFSIWFLSMDITPLIFGENEYTWDNRVNVSFWFGIGCLTIAYLIDLQYRRSRGDFAFWLYLVGLIMFWGSIHLLGNGNALSRFVYFLTNLLLILISVILKRRLFTVFGGLGVFGYLGYLSFEVFANSLIFPFILTALGIGIIYGGVLYQTHYPKLTRFFESYIPESFRVLIPKDR